MDAAYDVQRDGVGKDGDEEVSTRSDADTSEDKEGREPLGSRDAARAYAGEAVAKELG